MCTRVTNPEELFGGVVGRKYHSLFFLRILIATGFQFQVFDRSLGRRLGGDGGIGGGEPISMAVKSEGSELACQRKNQAVEIGGGRRFKERGRRGKERLRSGHSVKDEHSRISRVEGEGGSGCLSVSD